jgi:hypothetical protein
VSCDVAMWVGTSNQAIKEGDEDSAPPRGVSWKPLRRAKTESLRRRFSRLAPRRYHTLCEKFSHEGLSVDKGSPRYNPLLSTSSCISGIVQIYTHDRRKGSTKGVEGKKAGYDYTRGEGSLQIRTRYEDIRKESTSRDSSRESLPCNE